MNHLNEEQIAGMLAAYPNELQKLPELAEAQSHLATCADCAGELARMQQSIALFREASTAYAEANLHRVPVFQPGPRRPLIQPAYWALAAAGLLLAVLPMQLHRTTAPAPQTPVVAAPQQNQAESDEALLESVNREVSESVPTPMAALADPTGSTSQAPQNSTQRTN